MKNKTLDLAPIWTELDAELAALNAQDEVKRLEALIATKEAELADMLVKEAVLEGQWKELVN